MESSAPIGYALNKEIIHVYVDETGVYANAGTVQDGVRVGQYAGWMINSMAQFSTEDAIDGTLTFIKSTLQTKETMSSSANAPIEGSITWQNKYSNMYDRYIFLAEDVGQYITEGSNLYQFTDAGIPVLELKQNSSVTPHTIIFNGTINGTDIDLDHYTGPVTVYKEKGETSEHMETYASDGTLSFWLEKNSDQKLGRVIIDGQELELNKDYFVYSPTAKNLENTDISNLFATETLVQVADQGIGTVNVTKKLENVVEGSPEADTPFFFTITGQYDQVTKLRLVKEDGTEATFSGTLNVRLRNTAATNQPPQNTATTISVQFKEGEANIYLDPGYEVEHIYIPTSGHNAAGLTGQISRQILLNDKSVNDILDVTLKHRVVADSTNTIEGTFTNGVAKIWCEPDYIVESVSKNDISSVTSRFHTCNFNDIQNLGLLDYSATAKFTENTPVIASDKDPSDKYSSSYVDITGSGPDFNLAFTTNENGDISKARFALYGGQSISISGLPAGLTYQVYEYGAETGDTTGNTLSDKWEIKVSASDGVTEVTGQKYKTATGALKAKDEHKVTFTNTLRIGSISVKKVVSGNAASEVPADQAFTFKAKFTYEDRALSGNYPYTILKDETEVSANELQLNNAGEGTFTLKHGETIIIKNLPENTTFEINEDEKSADGFDVLVDPNKDSDDGAEGTISGVTSSFTFSNIKNRGDLVFYKVAVEDYTNRLPGATFKLFRLTCKDPTNPEHNHTEEILPTDDNNIQCWEFSGNQASSDDEGSLGRVSYKSLYPNSEYRLIETGAPNERITPKGQWRITTDKDAIIKITPIAAAGENPPVFVTDKAGNLLLPNTKAFNLPSSGMDGPTRYLKIGALLMSGAIALLLITRKKRDKS